jgi:hypothetical protein
MPGLEPNLAGRTGSGRVRTWVVNAAALVLVLAGQIWIVSAGRWTDWPAYTSYYSDLADAFLHGQTSLLITPAPEILTAANPFYPKIADNYGLHDAVYFQGKYYLYWGPVPALLEAAAARIAGVDHPDFGDQYLAWIFQFLAVAFAAALCWRIGERLFAGDGAAATAAAIVSLGLGTPGLYLLSRAAIYEAAIAAGQCFMLAGFLAAWEGMHRPAGKGRSWLLFWAGLSWALSFGSRLSLGPAALLAALAVAWKARRERSLRAVAGMFAPMIGGVALLLYYNFARFGSVAEFGMKYQLVSWNMYNLRNAGIYSPAHVVRNIACYLFAGPYRLRGFPYVIAFSHREFLGRIFSIPDQLAVEPLVGLLWSQPFLAFAAAALIGRRYAWPAWSLCVAGVLGLAPVLGNASYAMRYLMDAVPCLTVVAFIGYGRILESRRGGWGRVIRCGVWAVLAGQSLLAILLALNGPSSQFPKFNRPLYDAMRHFFAS